MRLPLHDEPLLVVDVGGTRIKWAVVNNRKVMTRGTDTTPTGNLDLLLEQLNRVVDRFPALRWALALPHDMDTASGMWRDAFDLVGVKDDVPIVQLLQARNLFPLVVASDLLVAAAGEADGGSLGLVQIGTGVGIAVVEDGTVLTGPGGLLLGAGLKHIRFRESELACPECGLRGCIFLYACLRGHWRRLGIDPTPDVDPLYLLRRSESGDPLARDILTQAFDAWGFLAATLIASCRVQTVRFAGGVVSAWEERARSNVMDLSLRHIPPRVSRGARIEFSKLQENAPLIGLADLAVRQLQTTD
ncbi:MAG: ROK family protein [Actinobacteria bacterium]|nr:ROK family protein [Actinomycetota bacterium]